MPKTVLLVRNGLALAFAAAAIWLAWRAHEIDSWGPAVFAVLHAAASIGLWRGVVWGRFLASCAMVYTALALIGFFIPADQPDGTSPFLDAFGFDPPIWVGVVLAMLLAATFLSPLVIIGWKRNYFRKSFW